MPLYNGNYWCKWKSLSAWDVCGEVCGTQWTRPVPEFLKGMEFRTHSWVNRWRKPEKYKSIQISFVVFVEYFARPGFWREISIKKRRIAKIREEYKSVNQTICASYPLWAQIHRIQQSIHYIYIYERSEKAEKFWFATNREKKLQIIYDDNLKNCVIIYRYFQITKYMYICT